MEYIVRKQISNHPKFEDVERYVCVYKQESDSISKTFAMYFAIEFIKNGVDISSEFVQKKRVIEASTKTKVLLRDEEGMPIPNPEFEPPFYTPEPIPNINGGEPITFDPIPLEYDEYDEYLWVDGWTFISNMFSKPVVINTLIEQYITINDLDNYFD